VRVVEKVEKKLVIPIDAGDSGMLLYSPKIEINKDRSFVVSQNFLSSILKYETHCFEDFLSKSITPEITDSLVYFKKNGT
jgi:hypothetical protein